MNTKKYTGPVIEGFSKVYIIGDVHGCYRTMRKLLEDQLCPGQDDCLVFLGDLISRGRQNKLVLDYLLGLEAMGQDLVLIRGNHEQRLLMAYSAGFDFLEHYLASQNCMDLLDGDLHQYLDFCGRMHYYATSGDWLLSHVGFSDKGQSPLNNTASLFAEVKICIEGTAFPQVHAQRTTSPLEIRKSVEQDSQKITIDAGCVYTHEPSLGYLCSLELNEMELYFQKNIESKVSL